MTRVNLVNEDVTIEKPAPCSICGAPCAVLCDWDGYKPKCSEVVWHVKYIAERTWAEAIMKWNKEVEV